MNMTLGESGSLFQITGAKRKEVHLPVRVRSKKKAGCVGRNMGVLPKQPKSQKAPLLTDKVQEKFSLSPRPSCL